MAKCQMFFQYNFIIQKLKSKHLFLHIFTSSGLYFKELSKNIDSICTIFTCFSLLHERKKNNPIQSDSNPIECTFFLYFQQFPRAEYYSYLKCTRLLLGISKSDYPVKILGCSIFFTYIQSSGLYCKELFHHIPFPLVCGWKDLV